MNRRMPNGTSGGVGAGGGNSPGDPILWIHTERKALLTIGSGMREPRWLARRGYGCRRMMRSIRERRSRR
jgi:hypothetical protein